MRLVGAELPTGGLDGSSTRSRSASRSSFRKPLITDEPWDHYHLESLLPLKETCRENTEFGFLLRHYWIPATVLTFRQASRTAFQDRRVEERECEIERTMARCRSNECLWREKVFPISADGKREQTPISEMLCSYDCYEQTYATAGPILFAPPTAEQKLEARRQALHRLPVLCPPGPNPIGFCWYAKVGDDYMNYRLEAEEHIGETSVLVIRREGQYTTWVAKEAFLTGTVGMAGRAEFEKEKTATILRREGMTLFSWNRGAVLEDRYQDRVIEADGQPRSNVGASVRVVTRLVRSCPEGS
jgi:hypothetical protein